MFQNNLRWDSHNDLIIRKIIAKLKYLRSELRCGTSDRKLLAYKTIIRPSI